MNIKNNFLNMLNDCRMLIESIRAAQFYYTSDDGIERRVALKEGYSQEELKNFLHNIDFETEGEFVYGTVWFKEKAWAELSFEGTLEWNVYLIPDIPPDLRAKDGLGAL